MDILRSFYNRRSSVVFSTKAIAENKIQLLFKAATLAPSSMNHQPWRFVYATRDMSEDYKALFNSLMEGNKIWAQQVPLLILTVAELIPEYKNRENFYAIHDTGMATSNLLLQATEMGLVSHPMGGFDKNMVREKLGISEKYIPVAILAVGYPGNIHEASSELRERELKARSRKPMQEVVFRGKFG